MGKSRIIAGEARSRRIDVPEHVTRPTSDRAREGLFSSLQARCDIEGARVLDLFAGSGALGLEAASRGAAEVVLVESDAQAAATIRANMAVVGHPNLQLAEMKVSTYVGQAPQGHFDILLADPPYDLADESVREMLKAVTPALADGAAVVVERHVESPETDWPAGLTPTTQKLKKRTYGIARMDMAVYHREDKE